MKNQRITRLIFETYLAVIKNSVGSKMFRNFYAQVNGKKVDVMENGNLSCALYVSSILALFKFIDGVHGTVDSTVEDLKKSGWQKIQKPKLGSVIVWEEAHFGQKNFHKHIGFFIGNRKVISNSSKKGYPIVHHYTFKNTRKIELILWRKDLK